MPFKSAAQMRWGNSPAGHEALGEEGVQEWNKATAGRDLPEHVPQRRDYKATPKRRRKEHGPVI